MLLDKAYQEIFAVEYFENDFFSVNLSFTILDWIILQRVIDDKNYFFDEVEHQ